MRSKVAGAGPGGTLSGALTLRQLEYFVHAANEGSINRAAKGLGVAQSAMSRQLRSLEREVGVALLLRTSGGVALTHSGKEFWSYSSAILDLLRHSRAVLMHSHAHHAESGKVAPPVSKAPTGA